MLVLAIGWAYLIGATGLPLVHALESGPDVGVHIEVCEHADSDADEQHADPVDAPHDEDTCSTCQLLATIAAAAPADFGGLDLVFSADRADLAIHAQVWNGGAVLDLHAPRGPPLL